MTKTSDISTPMTSVATSGLPVRVTTRVTSRNRLRTRSISNAVATDSLNEMLGSRHTCTARSPSSNRGTNSIPNRLPASRLTANRPTAKTTGQTGRATAR